MKPYNSAKEGFAMDYPATWQLDDTSHPHFVTFLSPLENEEDKFDEAMKVLLRARACPENAQYPGQVDKVIEINAGQVSALGLKVGDTVQIGLGN